jgi:hypothetical protein
MSALVDGDLPAAQAGELALHLRGCPACDARWRELNEALDALSALPRLAPSESISSAVRDRLEVESRGPGLALLFRSAWAARPLILPSLVPAALVLATTLTGAILLDQEPLELPQVKVGLGILPPSGTEANPLFPSAEVGVPRIRERDSRAGDVMAAMPEGSAFFETVVARDGSVSDVTLLDGNELQAAPLMASLRRERFEPVRFRGRPVAVSVYRLISHMEVRAPLT